MATTFLTQIKYEFIFNLVSFIAKFIFLLNQFNKKYETACTQGLKYIIKRTQGTCVCLKITDRSAGLLPFLVLMVLSAPS